MRVIDRVVTLTKYYSGLLVVTVLSVSYEVVVSGPFFIPLKGGGSYKNA